MINNKECDFILNLSEQEICELHEAYNIFDDNSDGCIGMAKLLLLFSSLKLYMTEKELKKIIQELGINNTNKINFNQFLEIFAKKLQRKDLKDESYLRILFDSMDRNRNGKISIHEIRYIALHSNENISEPELEMLIKEVDNDGDGLISYDEFLYFMHN